MLFNNIKLCTSVRVVTTRESGSDPREEQECCRPALGPTQPPVHLILRALSGSRKVEVDANHTPPSWPKIKTDRSHYIR
jgi:hypothetical protein